MTRIARCTKGQTVAITRDMRERIEKIADARQISIGEVCRELASTGQRRMARSGRWPADDPDELTERVTWMDSESFDTWIHTRAYELGWNVSRVRRALLAVGLW